MVATETLLQGATQVTSSLSGNYTAGGGTLTLAAALLDHGGGAISGPFEILVGRNRPLSERRYFVATPSGSNLTVTPSPGYTDNQNFVIGDLVDLISAWETQRRLRAFATLHTHAGTVDGTVVPHANLSGVGTNTHAAIDTALTAAAAANALDLTHRTTALPSVHSMPANALGIFANDGSGTLSWSGFAANNPSSLLQPGSITFTTDLARHIVAGKLFAYTVKLTATAAGTTANSILVTLPFSVNAATGQTLGTFRYDRISGPPTHGGIAGLFGAANVVGFFVPTLGFIGSGVAFAIAIGDILWFTICGEAV